MAAYVSCLLVQTSLANFGEKFASTRFNCKFNCGVAGLALPRFEVLPYDRAKASIRTEFSFYPEAQINGLNPTCYLRGLLHNRAKALVLPGAVFVKTFLGST